MIKVLFVSGMALFVAVPVLAQSVQDLAAIQAAQIQREEGRASVTSTLQAPTGAAAPDPIQATVDQSEKCLDIFRVNVGGVRLIRPSEIDRVVGPFEGTCLGLKGINSVLENVTFAYVDKGYITARAYLPEQDLSDGILEVVVVEGTLEAILMNGDPNALLGQKSTAFPRMIGRALNLRDVEQGLDQMGRLRSVDARMEIGAGSENGASVLAVQRNADRPWHGSIGIDNHGSEATGENILSFDVGFDDTLGLNDSISIGYKRSMSHFPLRPSAERPNGDTLTMGIEVPYGYWTFGANAMRNFYRSEINGALGTIDTSGSSTNLSFSADRTIYRNQTAKTSLSASFTWKDTQSYVLGSLVDVSSRSLSVLDVSLKDARQAFGGQLSTSIGVQQGLDIFGAFDDSTAPAGSPVGQFRKYDVSMGFSRAWSLGNHGVSYSGAMSGQWSNDLLFGTEQMSLGGRSSVRGSESGLLFGNRAVHLRNEVSWQFPKVSDVAWAPIIGQIEPYGAVDVGKVWDQATYSIQGGSLAGGAIGVRTKGGRVAADLSYADLISGPDRLQQNLDAPGVFSAKLSLDF